MTESNQPKRRINICHDLIKSDLKNARQKIPELRGHRGGVEGWMAVYDIYNLHTGLQTNDTSEQY